MTLKILAWLNGLWKYWIEAQGDRVAYTRLLGVKVGAGARIARGVDFGAAPWRIEIGDHVTIAEGVTFATTPQGGWIRVEDHASISPGSVLHPGPGAGRFDCTLTQS